MSERCVAVGIGTNLGSRWASLRAALDRIGAMEGVTAEAVGRPRATEALVLPGQPPGPPFLNGVCRVRTGLAPEALLDRLHGLEAELGRVRERKWAARTMDLDLLTWDGPPLRTQRLALPHAELSRRPFALAGVADVALGPSPGAAAEREAPFLPPPRILPGPTRIIRAADDADALAWGLTTATPAAPFEPLRAPSPEAFVDRAGARGAVAAVVFTIDGEVRGATAVGAGDPPPRWALARLRGGHCELHLVE